MLMIATVPSMIGCFNMDNIHILLELEYEVHVACNFRDISVWPKERVEAFIKDLKGLNIVYHHINFSRNPKDIKQIIHAFRQVDSLIKYGQFQFVHCHTPIAALISRIVCHRYNVKVIYTVHGFHFFSGAPVKNWLLFYPIEKLTSRYTDILITINKEDYRRARKAFYTKKTVYIPGVGIDTKKFVICWVDREKKRQELGVMFNDFLLLSVDELSEQKNQKVIIDALIRMKSDGIIRNIVYLIVAKGDTQEELERLIKEFDIEDHVKLLGNRTDIDELCKTVDCFVYPSIYKEYSIALMEAMAAGLPLIFTNINGIKDQTKEAEFGCCIDPTSLDTVVNAIVKMQGDKEFRRKCAFNNWKIAKTFEIQNVNDIIKNIYSEGYSHLKNSIERKKKREENGIPLDAILLISVGELSIRKNHEIVINALNKINNPNLYYIIAGKGELENKLKRMDKTGRLRLLGYRADIVDLLHISDIFIFPSLQEGLPVALMEAISCQMPILCSKIRGNIDLIEEEKFLFNPRNIDSLVNCLKQMIDTMNYKNSHDPPFISNSIYKVSINFDKESVNREMKSIYKQILIRE